MDTEELERKKKETGQSSSHGQYSKKGEKEPTLKRNPRERVLFSGNSISLGIFIILIKFVSL